MTTSLHSTGRINKRLEIQVGKLATNERRLSSAHSSPY